jgi:hypothetical protein
MGAVFGVIPGAGQPLVFLPISRQEMGAQRGRRTFRRDPRRRPGSGRSVVRPWKPMVRPRGPSRDAANPCAGFGQSQEAGEDHEHRLEYGERAVARHGVAEHALFLRGAGNWGVGRRSGGSQTRSRGSAERRSAAGAIRSIYFVGNILCYPTCQVSAVEDPASLRGIGPKLMSPIQGKQWSGIRAKLAFETTASMPGSTPVPNTIAPVSVSETVMRFVVRIPARP